MTRRRRKAAQLGPPPTCPYCQQPAAQVGGAAVYPQRPDLAHKRFWLCEPCGAYVGCHPDGKPFGVLADAELRKAKIAAHDRFDPIWREMMKTEGLRKGQARARAYAWLAERLRLDTRECHIGRFNVDQCAKVIEVCGEFVATPFLASPGNSPAPAE